MVSDSSRANALEDLLEALKERHKYACKFDLVRINTALPPGGVDLVVATTNDAWHWLVHKQGGQWKVGQDFWHRHVTLLDGRTCVVFAPGLKADHIPIEVFRAISTACECL